MAKRLNNQRPIIATAAIIKKPIKNDAAASPKPKCDNNQPRPKPAAKPPRMPAIPKPFLGCAAAGAAAGLAAEAGAAVGACAGCAGAACCF